MDKIVWDPKKLSEILTAVESRAYHHQYMIDPVSGPPRIETLLRCARRARGAFVLNDLQACHEALYGAVWAAQLLSKPPERILAAA